MPKYSTDNKNWAKIRENEAAKFDSSYGSGLKGIHVSANIKFLQPYLSHKFKLKLYDVPHIGRITITDNYLFYSGYTSDKHGKENRVYKYRRGGEMYQSMKRYFNLIWQNC